MNRIGAFILGVSALVMPASVQAQTMQTPSLRQTSDADSVALPVGTSHPQHPLVVAGQVGVYVWAPVEPAYNAKADRNLAADPLWEAEGPRASPSP